MVGILLKKKRLFKRFRPRTIGYWQNKSFGSGITIGQPSSVMKKFTTKDFFFKKKCS